MMHFYAYLNTNIHGMKRAKFKEEPYIIIHMFPLTLKKRKQDMLLLLFYWIARILFKCLINQTSTNSEKGTKQPAEYCLQMFLSVWIRSANIWGRLDRLEHKLDVNIPVQQKSTLIANIKISAREAIKVLLCNFSKLFIKRAWWKPSSKSSCVFQFVMEAHFGHCQMIVTQHLIILRKCV